MTVGTMRFRFDRRSGKELSRTFFDPYEMSEAEYSDRLITAMTGTTPKAGAHQIMTELKGERLEVQIYADTRERAVG